MVLVRLRAEERRHQSQLEKFALKVELRPILPTVPNSSQAQDHFAHFFDRFFPLHAEAPLIVSFDLSAEAHNKAAVGETREIPAGVGQDGRAAGESYGDTRSQTQVAAVLSGQQQWQERLMGRFECP